MRILTNSPISVSKAAAIKYCQKMIPEDSPRSDWGERWVREANLLAVVPGNDTREIYENAVAREQKNRNVMKNSFLAGLAGVAGTLAGLGGLALANLANAPALSLAFMSFPASTCPFWRVRT